MKQYSLVLKIVFSIAFLAIFVNAVTDFRSSYFKFSTIDIIYRYKLGKLYYFIAGAQLFLATGVFFTGFKYFRSFFEIILTLYTSLIIVYLIYLNYLFEGCVECSLGFNFFNERFKMTIVLSLMLFFLYFLSEWLKKKSIKQAT